MSFSGRVNRESHLGGLLVDFEGRPPRLGARIRVSGGKILGRVDTVIGPVGSALIHIHPLYNGIDPRASVGSPVEIAPREKPRQDRSRGRHAGGNFRERGGPGRETTREEAIEAGVQPEGAAETSETTREEAIEAGVQPEGAAETSETTREEAIEAGVQAILVGKPAILVVEEIQARAGAATGDVDPTPAFFIRLILRVLWRRVLR